LKGLEERRNANFADWPWEDEAIFCSIARPFFATKPAVLRQTAFMAGGGMMIIYEGGYLLGVFVGMFYYCFLLVFGFRWWDLVERWGLGKGGLQGGRKGPGVKTWQN